MTGIIEARSSPHITRIKSLFQEYADSLSVDLSFQNFSEELASLPGEYAPPKGRLLLYLQNDRTAGCVALRELDEGICEMKRLYVRPDFRGLKIGRSLTTAIIQEAKRIGYSKMRLDTLPTMVRVRALYKELGFKEIASYRFNPVEGTTYMELTLK